MALFGKGNDSFMILAMVVVGALVLWYLVGRESCEGCYHECKLTHYDDDGAAQKCAAKCVAKGLDCSKSIQAAAMQTVEKPMKPLSPAMMPTPPPSVSVLPSGATLSAFEGDRGVPSGYAPHGAHQFGH